MRTTLDIEEDILFAVKEIARQKGVTCGKALSDLTRQSLTRRAYGGTRHGLPLFPVQPKAGVVTIEYGQSTSGRNAVKVYLLDVNVLIALSDPMHVHHESAQRWFAREGRKAWAACPLTEPA